jgi:hypothetical protein
MSDNPTSENGPPPDELWDESQDAEVTKDLPPEFFEGLLPDTDESDNNQPPDLLGSGGQFLYIGRGLKADLFTEYVRTYNFGTVPPNFVVIHHTAVPDTLHARHRHATWDSREQGLTEQQIYNKRLGQLTGIKNYYQNSLGWNRGPHLFIDERWIWLFTPMFNVGIHAAEGNGWPPNYSIGIEVVGDYTRVQWPPQVEALVGHAVAVIKQRLGTFELVHRRFAGGVSGHRDYNKPSCPGNAVTNAYYMGVLRRGWDQLQRGGGFVSPMPDPDPATKPTPPKRQIDANSSVMGEESGSIGHAIKYIQERLPDDSEYKNDVQLIMSYYWKYAPPVGVDPFFVAAQCIFETDSLRSHWAGRPRRNPAGLGVRHEGGLSFATWDEAVQAHIGQLLAYVFRDNEANDAQRDMMRKNPRHRRIGLESRGSVKKIADLNNRWTTDSNYANKLLNRIRDVLS